MAIIDRPARQHARWLALLDIAGPFLSMPVLLESFPHGLDLKENEVAVRRRTRLGYDEWAESQARAHPDAALHGRWLRFVLEEVLEIQPDAILEGQDIPPALSYTAREYGELLRPTTVIQSPFEEKPRLMIQLYPASQPLDRVAADKAWKASPATRMMELLRNTGVRLGLVTNGRYWMLVDAPSHETTGYYTWNAELWSEEPLTLQAFRSLLGMERFFNVRDGERLEDLLNRSALKQHEVTTRLGEQVREAVETLVRTLDRLDKDSQRVLLHEVTEKQLYEAALTVMMRIVFLLSAEERELLMLGLPLYDDNYAVSTMVKQLQEQADQQTEEVLGLRFDAWSRLLAIFRVVYAGVEHPDLRLPAYGGHLFDPDRYPFLEGRKAGTSWLDTPAEPLSIDNRTVLHLLRALQYLQVDLPGGGKEARRLSFRGLDVEQIGHVYEGLLDHTAKRATSTMLGLSGANNSEPEIMLEEIEQHAHKGGKDLIDYLQRVTGKQANALQKALALVLEKPQDRSHLMAACDNKQELFDRVLPYAALIRKDSLDNYIIVTPGSIFVTAGADRRSTGSHYTPRSLTEPIVQHALDPLVYSGPAEGWPEDQWQLKSVAEILDLKICDMAMGSGAFLVQSCRYLSQKLVRAWEQAEAQSAHAITTRLTISENGQTLRLTTEGQPAQNKPDEELLPDDPEERLAIARRLIAERCLYGVDKNPMAVEMTKLSLWLITLSRNKPFSFLDHALRYGDSLLGVNERQLANWSMDARQGVITDTAWIRGAMIHTLPTAIKLRKEINAIHDHDVRDIEAKGHKLQEADEAMEIARLGADLLIVLTLCDAKRRGVLEDTVVARYFILAAGYEEGRSQKFTDLGWQESQKAFKELRAEVDELLQGRRPFHWPLEFPEVFVGKGENAGFAAIVGNPPFMGGSKITGSLGTDYREHLVRYVAGDKRGGRADLCAYFFLRASQLTMKQGIFSLIATNTIAQGDTREVGLDQLITTHQIIRAIPSRKWPGEASLEVAYLWLRSGEWHGLYVLDNMIVSNITSSLTAPRKVQSNPYRLTANTDKSFKGSFVLGMGFVLTPEEALALIAKDTHNTEVLYPYLNAEDLNSRPDQSPSRWVINFFDWPLERAETYIDCMRIVREKVKPERGRLGLKTDASAKGYAKLWWQYGRRGQALYLAISDMKRVLVIPRVSKYMICTWEMTGIVYSEATIVVPTESSAHFALIQCTFHNDWTRANGSSLRNDQRYTPSDCFETFPFPPNTTTLESIGEQYYTHRQAIMLANQQGLTKTYNRFHDPNEPSPDILQLRELHREMDEAVARAYGWDDLELGHGFHETKQGERYTISEAARREVLDRLLLLNHQRHEEEVKSGVLDKKGKAAKGKGKAKKAGDETHGAVGNRRNGIQASKGGGSSDTVEITPVEQGTLFGGDDD